MGRPYRDLAGQQFDRLIAIKVVGRHGRGRSVTWLCRCVCGRDTTATGSSLSGGRVRSCGCLARENGRMGAEKKLLPDNQGAKNKLYRTYKWGSEKRRLPFTLTCDEFIALTQRDCSYCGSPPSSSMSTRRNRTPETYFWYNGVDRQDNSKGYTPDNSVPCCGKCNFAKGSQSVEDFVAHIRKILRHQESRTS
jgi:5-methylcytosine-specific restriction endonuclease McrA